MKYGQSEHWQASKEALFLMPHSLEKGIVQPAKDRYKYEVYFRKRNCIYIVGVPSPMGDATIMVSCQKRETKKKPIKRI